MAMQWTGDDASTDAVVAWLGEVDSDGDRLTVRGATPVKVGEWIVLSPNNRMHICQPGTFEEVHELALADPEDTDLANMQAAVNAARAAANYWKKLAQRMAERHGEALPAPPPIPMAA